MTCPVVTVPPASTVGEVADVLRGKRISGLPVVDDDGVVLGLVSEYDLLAKPGRSAADVMTTTVISVSPDTPVSDVRHLLVDRRVGRVLVTSGGRLVGIVSRGDVVALLATEWVCQVCGEAVRADHRPDSCPRCKSDGERFVLVEQPPGS